MLRGVERRPIFLDDRDREDFLRRLHLILPEALMRCLAWAFMPNHVHLVVQTGPVPLARVMARIGTGYAQAFNRRHDRVGHLFQNRYKSILVTDDAQLKALVRYVHRNPLEAGLVPSLEELAEHPWTGHSSLMGRTPAPFQDTRSILELFGQRPREARRRLGAWMEVESEADAASIPTWDHVERHRGPSPPHSIDSTIADLVATVCAARGIPELDFRHARTRLVTAARTEVVHRACTELGASGAEVARELGMSPGAVSMARARARRLASSAIPLGNN